jgi:hypothetical protein
MPPTFPSASIRLESKMTSTSFTSSGYPDYVRTPRGANAWSTSWLERHSPGGSISKTALLGLWREKRGEVDACALNETLDPVLACGDAS